MGNHRRPHRARVLIGALSGRRRRPPRCDSGQAVASVIAIIAMFVVLTYVAFGAANFAASETDQISTNSGAGPAAAAGVAAALYDLAAGNYTCAIASTNLPVTPGAGASSYSATITYYDSYADPEPAPTSTNSRTCSSGALPSGSTFGAAQISAIGTTRFGTLTITEQANELLQTFPQQQSYALFTGSALTMTNLKLPTPTTGNTAPAVVYANGNVVLGSGSSGTPPAVDNSACLNASVIAVGTLSFANGKCVNGNIYSDGNTVLSASTVGGTASVVGGNLVMSHSIIAGNALVEGSPGSILMCPNPVSGNASCSGLNSGQSIIGQTGGTPSISNASATGTITLGAVSESTICPGPVIESTSKNEVTGCVYPSNANNVAPPSAIPFPGESLPVQNGTTAQQSSYAAWTAAGYTIETATTCTGTGSGSVIADMTAASTSTVIIANCALTLSTGTVTLSHNVALFATSGMTVANGFKVAGPSAGSVQLSLVVPTPTGSYSCTGSYGLTISSGGDINSGHLNTFAFTPCAFTISAAVPLTGTVVAGSVSLSNTFTLTYSALTLPGLGFGYQYIPTERYTNGA